MKFIKIYYYLVLLYVVLSIPNYIVTLLDQGIIDFNDLILWGLYEFILFILSIIVFIKIKRKGYDKSLKIVPLFMIILWITAFIIGVTSSFFIVETVLLNPTSSFNFYLGIFDLLTNIIILIFSIIALKTIFRDKSSQKSEEIIKDDPNVSIKKRKKWKVIIGVVLIIIIFLAISTWSSLSKGVKIGKEVQPTIDQFISYLQDDNYQQAYDLFSDLAKTEISIEALTELRENELKLYTDIVGIEFSGFEMNHYNGPGYNGDYYQYQGKVTYTDGTTARATAGFIVNNNRWELINININKSF